MEQTLNSATREQLRKRLKELLENENQELIDAHYPEFKALEGKCFKSENYYSCDEERWLLYTKVQSILPEHVYVSGENVYSHFEGLNFQQTKDGVINIEPIKHGFVHSLGEEISAEEFDAAWDSILSEINILKCK